MRALVNLMIASMIFFPVREFSFRPEEFGLTFENAWCETQDGLKIHGWFLKAPNASTCLLFFHGNADNISIRLPKAQEWVKRGVSVLLVDYRGYGQSEGKIKKGKDLYADGEAAFKWLREAKNLKPEQLILYGESIGSVPAIELALNHRFKSIVLEAPFTSIVELARHHYGGWIPEFLLKDFLLDNEAKISQLKAPLFILHGEDDEIVPITMGKRLFEQAPEPKQFFEIPGAHHNDISEVGGTEFYERPFRFATDSKP